MRHATLAVVLLAMGCAAPGSPRPSLGSFGLDQAARNYPPLIIGANTEAVAGPIAARPCAASGGRVEQKGGPTFEFLGATEGEPTLCQMRVDGQAVQAWYDIWLVDWPGEAEAGGALKRVMAGGTGDVEGFDVRMAPGYDFHDLIRNEGVETIKLLGTSYKALKISHYREGFNGNIYRSVSTIWKDIPTGLLLYGTYQHIAGTPVIDDPLLPTKIVAGR